MHKNRSLAVSLTVLLILSLGCGPLGQVVSTQSSGQTSVSPASPTALAAPKPTSILPETAATNNPQTLADAITHAATDDERYNALLKIMKALNLGVYTGKGEAILLGAERGPSDFYLYDFEVSAIAAALGRKETWTVSDLATQLSDIGVHPGGKPLPPQDLQKSLASLAIESIQDPGNPLSLVHLLIRELGLRRVPSYDISAATSSEQIKFDALQRFLILSDVLVPLGATPVQSHIFQKSVNLVSNEVFRLSASGDPCSFIGPEDVTGFKFGKLFATIMGIPGASDFVKVAGMALDYWHGGLLGLLMDVQETNASIGQHIAHYGPKGTHVGYWHPGEPMLFQLGVQMLADLSQYPKLQCGKLVGLTFPPKGPVRGVTIYWDHILYGGIADYALLKKHGTITREDATTDSNGLASLVFQPKDEPETTRSIRTSLSPHDITTVRGVLIPSVGIASSFGNVLAIGTDILIPKIVGIPFAIEFHEIKDWKVDLLVILWATPNTHISGLSCGSPYGPWEIKMEGTGGQGGAEIHGSFHVPFSEDGKATVTYEENGTTAGGVTAYQEAGTGDSIITPDDGGYRIGFKNINATISGVGGTIPFGPMAKVYPQKYIFPIIPADSGECPQP